MLKFLALQGAPISRLRAQAFKCCALSIASVSEPENSLKLPSGDRRHLLVFDVPRSTYGENLQSAELRLLITTVQRQPGLASDGETGTVPCTADVFTHAKSEHNNAQ
jgi:hypothetical protein